MRYAFSNGNSGTPQNMTTTYKTILDTTAATGATTLRRCFWYEWDVSVDTAPADNVLTWKVDRQSTTGTRTAITPPPLDAGDAASLVTCGANATIEPTVTASTQLWEMAINQRASYRWIAAPGSEIVMPATNVTGLGLRAKSPAYTSTALATLYFSE